MIKALIKDYSLRAILRKAISFYQARVVSNPVEFELEDNETILVLSPHPDDESIGFGGGLLKYGIRVDVVCITDGGKGIPGCSPKMASEIRRSEFFDAMSKCGVRHSFWLGVSDGAMDQALDRLLSLPMNAYSYIALPNWLDTHPDHCALAHLIAEAYKAGVISDRVKIIFYEVWNALAVPTHFVDLSQLAQKKKELIDMYRSQIAQINYSYRMLQLNAYRGMAVNVRYAEVYTIISASELNLLL